MRRSRFANLSRLWDFLFDDWSARLTKLGLGRRSGAARKSPIGWKPSRFTLETLEDRVTPDGRPLPLPFIFVGAATGAPPLVRAYNAETGALVFERQPFESGFTGGVRVTAGDVNHDGIPDLIAAAGPGAGPHIKIYDGVTGDLIAGALGSFFAYDSGFTGGVYVASGDVDGDGWADLITSAGAGAGPHVKVFSGRTAETLASFYAFAPEFAGGATIAAADFTGDGKADLVVGAGAGAGPHVKIFDLTTGQPIAGALGSFYAFDPSWTNGVDVGADFLAGDVTGDGHADLVVGLGAGRGSQVRVFNGVSGTLVGDFSPFGSAMTAGVRVALAYVNNDARADIVVGTGSGVAGTIKVFSGATWTELATPMSPYTPFGSAYVGGLYVGASNDPEVEVVLAPPPPPPLSTVWITGGSETGGSNASEQGPASGWFVVHRSDTGASVTVNYGAPGGTATNGTDYASLGTFGGSVTIASGQSLAYLYVDPVDDTLVEGDETVTVALASGSGYTVTGSAASLSIADNDGANAPPYIRPAPTGGGSPLAPVPGGGDPGSPAQTGGAADDGSVRVSLFGGLGGGIASSVAAGSGGAVSWTNAGGYADGLVQVGDGAVRSGATRLVLLNSGAYAAVIDAAGSALWFQYVSGGSYAALFGSPAGLVQNSGTGEFELRDGAGSTLVFYDFGFGTPAGRGGRLKSRVDAAGNVQSVVSWDAAGRPTEVQMTDSASGAVESLVSVYDGGGELTTLTRRRQLGGGAWATVRVATFTYASVSGVTEPVLVGTSLADAGSNVLEETYNRYYASGAATGYAGGLRFHLGAESTARLKAAYSGTALSALTDSQVAAYADRAFEYSPTTKRVTKSVTAGAGDSATAGGFGTSTFTYGANASPGTGINDWVSRVTETTEDGTVSTAYANANGQSLLNVTTEAGSGGRVWLSYTRYDSVGRVILRAAPSAVSGYSESLTDLVGYGSGSNATYLRDSDGLILTTTYGSSTTATSSTTGDVAGYVKAISIQKGETGTAVPQSGTLYIARTAAGATTYRIASQTQYRNDDGTGAETTTAAYTWQGTTQQAASVTTTLPTVTSGQNGPGTAASDSVVFDSLGRPIWSKDAAGVLSYVAYDAQTGAVVKSIADVNTANTSEFANLPSGWSASGMHLISTFEVDSLGRTTKSVDPLGLITYAVFNDANHEARVYAGWNTSTNLPTGPTKVVRVDLAKGYTEVLTMAATPTVSGGRPTGTESVASIQSLSRGYRNAAGQTTTADSYYDLTGVTYSTAANIGTQNTNFYREQAAYDNRGRASRAVSAAGTIDRTEYDALDRAVSTWVGTDDTPTTGVWSTTNLTGTNMVKVSEVEYDGGGVGDSNATKVTEFPGGGAANRVSQAFYDWRDRVVATKSGVETSESTSVNRPLTYTEYDNLDEAVSNEVYDGDAVAIVDAGGDGVPDRPTASLLRGKTVASHDELGRAYKTETYSVDPSTGSVSTSALTSQIWFDIRGLTLKTSSPGGLVQKTAYDALGRATTMFVTDGGGDSTWSDAGNVTGDTVLSQSELTYDADGNVLLAVSRERFHDATGTGALGTPSTGVSARVSYSAAYYDKLNRLTDAVDVGTNGASAYTRPGSVPSRSDTVLVSGVVYDAAGRQWKTVDPRGIESRTTYDLLGRTVKTIENYVDGTVSDLDDKTTEYTYSAAGMTSLTAKLTGGGGQTTEWVYGVGSSGNLYSNDTVGATKWPDPTTGSSSSGQQETLTVNALGQVLTSSDRNGSTHTLSYDVLGRVVSDAVTTLGSGVDGAVRRIETAYDSQGNAYLLTSYSAATGGSVVNQVQRSYNGLGQLTAEYQAHGGAVNTSTSPKVQYGYSTLDSNNRSRLTSMTYPNGRVVGYNYASGLDSNISRLSSITDSGVTLESYSYLGLSTVVVRAHPQTGVDLSYVKLSGESVGDAGDQYTGLDRFGRIVDQRWRSGSTDKDRFTYTYDRDGNRLTKTNALNSALNEVYTYDGLNQVASFNRGGGTRTQSFDYDALGNRDGVTTNGGTQTYTANKQNEITGISGATTPTYDANGNMTGDETGKLFVYDAWNRLVAVKNSGGTTLKTYGYDGMNRRVSETASSATTDLYYSANWQILEERVAGVTTVSYVWSPVYVDAMIARDRDTDGNGTLDERLYPTHDANFNVTALVNTIGSAVERYAYDTYGAPTVMNASWTVLGSSAYVWQYLHQGGRLDSTSGLVHFRNRDYSPTLGRWATMDPIRYAGGDVNLFRTEHNEPLVGSDPSGLHDPLTDSTHDLEWWVSMNGPPGRTWDPKRGYRVAAEGVVIDLQVVKTEGGVLRPEIKGTIEKQKQVEETFWRNSLKPDTTPDPKIEEKYTNGGRALVITAKFEISKGVAKQAAIAGAAPAIGAVGEAAKTGPKRGGVKGGGVGAVIILGAPNYKAEYIVEWTITVGEDGKLIKTLTKAEGTVLDNSPIGDQPHWEIDQPYARNQALTPGDKTPSRN